MFLHLLRFQFDGTSSQVIKNNNFFQFTEHLDLTEFVREDEGAPWKYTLFAVLSHCGGGSHGHYVAYINPALQGNWLKFDDDTVSLVHRCDAIDANFGGGNELDEWMKFNAYMLVYVRASHIDEIFEAVDPVYITDELRMAVNNDPDNDHYYNHQSKRNHFTNDVYVFLSSFLEADFRFGVTKYDRPLLFHPKFAVTRELTTRNFMDLLQTAFNIAGNDKLRIWPIYHSSNNYSHPVYIHEDAPFIATLSDISKFRYHYSFTVWLEMATPGSELPPFDPEKHVLVFYYFYCARECRPFYINHGYHDKNAKVGELVPLLNQLMGWPNQDLNIYQELRETKVIELDPSYNIEYYVPEPEFNMFLMNVIFEPKEHDMSAKLNSVVLYFHDIMFRATFVLCHDDRLKNEENFHVSVLLTFPELVDMLASRLNYDRRKIQIFKCQPQRPARGDPIPSTSTESLRVLLNCTGYEKVILFYKLHRIDVIDVETKHNFAFQSLSIDMKKFEKMTMYLSDNDTIDSIQTEASKIISPDPHGSGKFRVVCVSECRLSVVKDAQEIYDHIEAAGIPCNKRHHYRIEEIPRGDDMLDENEKLVVVSPERHFSFYSRTPPYSFIFKVNMNDTWQCVKDRLRARLNFSETMWGDYRPVIIITDNFEVVDMDDTKCLNDYEQLSSAFTICLQCKNKAKRTCNVIDLTSHKP